MKKRTIIDIVIIILLLGVIIFLGSKDYSYKKESDNVRFSNEYNLVENNNVFTYKIEEEILEVFKNKKDAVIYFAFKENEWANHYAYLLNESAKQSGLKEIYYYDFYKDRAANSKVYEEILTYLKIYLKVNDKNQMDIYAPTLIIIKNGIVNVYDDETSFNSGNLTPKKYWTNENKEIKINQLNSWFNNYLYGEYYG